MVSMFVDQAKTQIDDIEFRILFLSRRACTRQGTRLTCRGINAHGQVANYVETEQIVVRADKYATVSLSALKVVAVVQCRPTCKFEAPCRCTGNSCHH